VEFDPFGVGSKVTNRNQYETVYPQFLELPFLFRADCITLPARRPLGGPNKVAL